MKVLIIGTSVAPMGLGRYAGVEKMAQDFAIGLRDAGQEVTILAPQGSKAPSGIELIESVKLPEEQDRDDIAIDKLAKYITSLVNVDNVPTWDIVHDFSHRHILGLKNKITPAVFMLWDPVLYKYEKSIYNICCASNWQKDRFEKLYNQKAIKDWRWVDTSFYKNDSYNRNDRFLYLGGLRPPKGADLAITYAQELNVPIDIVGGLIPSEAVNNGYLDNLYKLAEQGGDVKIHFNVTEEEKLRFLQTAKAFIYPVRQEEAHCLAMIEAWVCGLPVLTFNRGANKEIMYAAEDFVVDTQEEFKKKMGDIDTYSAKWVQKQAIEDYALVNVIPKWINLYEKVVGGLRW